MSARHSSSFDLNTASADSPSEDGPERGIEPSPGLRKDPLRARTRLARRAASAAAISEPVFPSSSPMAFRMEPKIIRETFGSPIASFRVAITPNPCTTALDAAALGNPNGDGTIFIRRRDDVSMLFLEHRYSRVMVFVDYMNIRECIQHGGKDPELDLLRLTRILVGNRELMGAYVFDASKKYSSENDVMIREHDRLRMDGFRVISRETMEKMADGRLVQKEVDVSLACEMLEHALMNHFDVAIVVSGDRDFVPAMQKVQAAGKRVEVASFKGSVNKECIKTADVYRQLDDIPFLMMRPAFDEGGDNVER